MLRLDEKLSLRVRYAIIKRLSLDRSPDQRCGYDAGVPNRARRVSVRRRSAVGETISTAIFSADEEILRAAFANIIENKAPPARIADDRPVDYMISFDVETEDVEVILELSDNGAGIPAEQLQDVFQLFAHPGARPAPGCLSFRRDTPNARARMDEVRA